MDVYKIIRDTKKSGKRFILWDEIGWNILKIFIIKNGMSYPKTDGFKFMCVKHFKIKSN